MRALVFLLMFIALVITAPSCIKDKVSREVKSDLSKGTDGWLAFFSDYPRNSDTFYELRYEYAPLPAPIDQGNALKISGNNHSDDLLCLIYKRIDGLKPNKIYTVGFSIDLASNVAKNSVGVGGSPDLMLGAGGTSTPPSNVVDNIDYYRPNFTVALQSGLPNEVMDTLGRIGVAENNTVYTMINRNNLSHKIQLKANENGQLWLMIGTDSGFEGITTLYYSKITVTLE